jgi:cyclomaltodextrinase
MPSKLVVLHNSQDLYYRTPFGAVPAGQRIRLRIRIHPADAVEEVLLRLWSGDDGERIIPMAKAVQPDEDSIKDGSCVYEVETASDHHQILWYYFMIKHMGTYYYYSRSDDRFGGKGCLSMHPLHSYQITVYKPEYHVPKWYREGVMYQIFPDRFHRTQVYAQSGFVQKYDQAMDQAAKVNRKISKKQIIFHENWEDTPSYEPDPETGEIRNNDFFGGTLQGILEKLDYLKDLGITILYLNPVFEAYSNHRYDTGDYKKIDPMLGDLNTFRQLCMKANAMGIRIILDGVFSHTGSDSVYFNKDGNYDSIGAWQSKDSPYAPWYRFRSFPEDYDCWWGIKTLPNVNELDPSYLDFIIRNQDSVVKYWLRNGAGGWRLDVADELPAAFLRELRKAVKETDPEAVVIGEVWEDASNKVSYGRLREYLLGEELDSVMSYPFRKLVLDFLLGYDRGENLHKGIMTLYENYPREAFFGAMNLLGTHDVTRLRTILGEAPPEISLTAAEQSVYRMTEEQQTLADRRQRLAVVLQMTLPGVPSIYYGDEAGMEGYRDPFNRGTYPWGREDKALLQWYKRLIHLRNATDALKNGEYVPVIHREGVFGFLRIISNNRDVFGEYAENGLFLVLINSSNTPEDIAIDMRDFLTAKLQQGQNPGLRLGQESGFLKDLLNDGKEYQLDMGKLFMVLEPLSSKILTIQTVY